MRKWAIVRVEAGSAVVDSGPHSGLGALLRMRNFQQFVVPWMGNPGKTLDAFRTHWAATDLRD